jgi:hypothetical protein
MNLKPTEIREPKLGTREEVFRELTAAELDRVTGGSLSQHCATGKHFANATLDVGGGGSVFGSSWGTDEAAGQRE